MQPLHKLFWALPALALSATLAQANPSLVIDVATGEVLHQEQATQTWFPASLTKLMTTYVALKAVREGRLTLDTPMVVSARAARMAPSKMGFRPGTEVTLDNALKMLMVKSPNDVAVTIAEGISGSVESFADEMNREASRLGMLESHWVNPNGLPDARQITTARDMALLGRALFMDFPGQADIFNIGALQLGSRIIPTHNGLMGRYPGVDGMKTGFTCAAGFNVVASATRQGRHVITVIMGAPSARDRTAKAANLFDRAFLGSSSVSGNVATLPSQASGTAPNIRDQACRGRSKGGSYTSEFEDFAIPLSNSFSKEGVMSERAFMFEAAGQSLGGGGRSSGAQIAALGRPHFNPISVYVGRAPGWTGPVLQARLASPVSAPNMPAVPVAPPTVLTAKAKTIQKLQPLANATAFAPPKPVEADDAASALANVPVGQPLQLKRLAEPKTTVNQAKPAAVVISATKPRVLASVAGPKRKPIAKPTAKLVPSVQPVPKPAPLADPGE